MTTEALRITHSPAAGTLLEGTRRGDGVNRLLREAPMQWRWSGHLAAFYAPHSRDRVAPQTVGIRATADLLRAAGHVVTVDLDGVETRSMEEREQDRADRTVARVVKLEERAQRRAGEARAARAASDRITEHIPFGQPVLLGHYSQRRHERDIEKIQRNIERSVDASAASREAARQAVAADARQALRATGPVTMRRIAKLEAEQRRHQRRLNGHERKSYDGRGRVVHVEHHDPASGEYRDRVERELTDVEEQLSYWRAHLDELRASGEYRVWTREDFAKGDWVLLQRYGWAPVLKVNAKSLSVPNPVHSALAPWKVTYDEVKDRRPAAEAD